MKIEANTIQEYISQLPEDRKEAIENLRKLFLKIYQKVSKNK
jgi:hypothetical protein